MSYRFILINSNCSEDALQFPPMTTRFIQALSS